MTDTPKETAIERAFRLAGGMSKLADKLGKTRGAVFQWKAKVPAEACPDIEALTGVRCEDLRPDINWGVLRKQAKPAAA